MGRRGFRILKALLDIGDMGVFFLSLCVAYELRFSWGVFPEPSHHPPFEPYSRGFALVSVLWFMVFWFDGIYSSRHRFDLEYVGRIVKLLFISTAFVLGAVFFYRDFSYSRLTVILSFFCAVVFVVTYHYLKDRLLTALVRRGAGRRKCLIVGTNELGIACFERLKRSPELGYDVVGFIGEREDLKEALYKTIEGAPVEEGDACAFPPVEGAVVRDDPMDELPPVIGGYYNVHELVRDLGVDEVFVAFLPAEHRKMMSVLGRIERLGIDITIVPNVLSIITSSVRLSEYAGMPVIRLEPLPIHGWGGVVKDVFDRVVAFAALVLLSPLFAYIAWRIKRESPGPVFYVQERVGLDGKVFPCYKFRSMRVDAEKETGPVWASKDDPRRTRFGEFLRKYSLDELPQLWNVLRGDMSLVGPRPERPFFVEQFRKRIPNYMDRHVVKCGITGWAQVNGLRGRTSIEERTRYDIWYIENWSLLLDVEILLKTVYICLFRPSGY